MKVRVDNPGSHEARYQEVIRRRSEWLTDPPNVLMTRGCRGMGVESFMISVHKTYADLDEFMSECRFKLGDLLEIVQFILVNLAGRELLKPFNPVYLAETEAKITWLGYAWKICQSRLAARYSDFGLFLVKKQG